LSVDWLICLFSWILVRDDFKRFSRGSRIPRIRLVSISPMRFRGRNGLNDLRWTCLLIAMDLYLLAQLAALCMFCEVFGSPKTDLAKSMCVKTAACFAVCSYIARKVGSP